MPVGLATAMLLASSASAGADPDLPPLTEAVVPRVDASLPEIAALTLDRTRVLGIALGATR